MSFFLDPLALRLMDATAGDDDMEVWMEIESSGMGMEDGGHADIGAEMFGILAKVFQGADGGVKEDVVDSGLMTPGERSEFKGQGEGDHEVLDRQELEALAVEPLGGDMVLAFGTTTVAAGLGLVYLYGAITALQLYLPGLRGTAAQHGIDSVAVSG